MNARPRRTFLPIVALLVALAPAARAADPQPLIPLVPGGRWEYKRTVRVDRQPAAPSDEVVTGEPGPTVDGKPTVVWRPRDLVLAGRDGGVFVLGRAPKGGKLDLFPEPVKLLPPDVAKGDKWSFRTPAGVTSATCLGTEHV